MRSIEGLPIFIALAEVIMTDKKTNDKNVLFIALF